MIQGAKSFQSQICGISRFPYTAVLTVVETDKKNPATGTIPPMYQKCAYLFLGVKKIFLFHANPNNLLRSKSNIKTYINNKAPLITDPPPTKFTN